MAGWRTVLAPAAAAVVRELPPDVKRSVRAALENLSEDPYVGKELLRDLRGLRSYRARRYRIVYEVSPSTREVRVVAVAHRSTLYEELAQERIARRTGNAVRRTRR
jgi:mRNA interferase RelE/StbE